MAASNHHLYARGRQNTQSPPTEPGHSQSTGRGPLRSQLQTPILKTFNVFVRTDGSVDILPPTTFPPTYMGFVETVTICMDSEQHLKDLVCTNVQLILLRSLFDSMCLNIDPLLRPPIDHLPTVHSLTSAARMGDATWQSQLLAEKVMSTVYPKHINILSCGFATEKFSK